MMTLIVLKIEYTGVYFPIAISVKYDVWIKFSLYVKSIPYILKRKALI